MRNYDDVFMAWKGAHHRSQEAKANLEATDKEKIQRVLMQGVQFALAWVCEVQNSEVQAIEEFKKYGELLDRKEIQDHAAKLMGRKQ